MICTFEGEPGDELDAAHNRVPVGRPDGHSLNRVGVEQYALADVAVAEVEVRGRMGIPVEGLEEDLLGGNQLLLHVLAQRGRAEAAKPGKSGNVLGLLFKLGWRGGGGGRQEGLAAVQEGGKGSKTQPGEREGCGS